MKSRPSAPALCALLATFTLGAQALPLAAEDLRTIIAGTVTLSSDQPEGTRLAIAYNEAVAVIQPKETPFIQGFEIEVKLPPAAIAMPGALAWELWRRVDPLPDRNRYGYQADRIITQPLPSRASLVLQVPMRKDFGLKSGPYATVIPFIVEQKDLPFIFRFEQVSKGMPSELENAQFQVRIRPLLTDQGALRLSLRYPEGGERLPVLVTVDDKELAEGHFVDGKEVLVLKAGTHYLRVSSERYRDENRSFALEQGRTLDLVVELQDTTPVVTIEAPDSAQLMIDGQKIARDAKLGLTVEPGDHVVSCRIGDYAITRKFTAYRGKSYKIVLSVDLQVQETP
jgi:hypothetical protein